jgi:hypothetical protein
MNFDPKTPLWKFEIPTPKVGVHVGVKHGWHVDNIEVQKRHSIIYENLVEATKKGFKASNGSINCIGVKNIQILEKHL